MLVAEQSCCDLPAVPAPESCTCNTLGSSGDWLTVLRVFGHGLCAWRYSMPALNPWSAPWMLRIGDRLPSTRSKSNRPTVMQGLGSKKPPASHSTSDSAVMGLTAAAGVLENSKIRSQWAASLWVDAAPAAQLLSSGYSAPKPICCGPVGRRRFPESWGSPRPAALPRMWEVLSPPRLVG